MERNPATHAAHDELLLARLYGGDLEGSELERVREMAASCAGCAAILADFGAIAAAAAELPVPPRPRDFTISAEQAGALRRSRAGARPKGLRAMLGRLGPVRSLGASMAAAGVAGILAVGAFSALGQTGAVNTWFRQADAPAAAGAGSTTSTQELSGPGAGQAEASAAGTSGAFVAVQSAPPKNATASDRNGLPGASPTAGPVSDDQYDSEGDGAPNANPAPAQSDSGPPWPLVFGGLAAGGLILLVAPAMARRRSAGRR
jgi:hypothetical protein